MSNEIKVKPNDVTSEEMRPDSYNTNPPSDETDS